MHQIKQHTRALILMNGFSAFTVRAAGCSMPSYRCTLRYEVTGTLMMIHRPLMRPERMDVEIYDTV